MNLLNSILVLTAAVLAPFLESACDSLRHLLGAQIDLLPALAVFAGLRTGLPTITLVALIGGLSFDTLSANPLGISILPLFLAGFLIYLKRELILQHQFYAQFVLGFAASACVPALTLVMLLNTSLTPVLGWGSLWQWLVMSLGGALLTPVCFWVFDGLNHGLSYRPVAESSFRPDREIRRGRN